MIPTKDNDRHNCIVIRASILSQGTAPLTPATCHNYMVTINLKTEKFLKQLRSALFQH